MTTTKGCCRECKSVRHFEDIEGNADKEWYCTNAACPCHHSPQDNLEKWPHGIEMASPTPETPQEDSWERELRARFDSFDSAHINVDGLVTFVAEKLLQAQQQERDEILKILEEIGHVRREGDYMLAVDNICSIIRSRNS